LPTCLSPLKFYFFLETRIRKALEYGPSAEHPPTLRVYKQYKTHSASLFKTPLGMEFDSTAVTQAKRQHLLFGSACLLMMQCRR
jgi:hypothetical protein